MATMLFRQSPSLSLSRDLGDLQLQVQIVCTGDFSSVARVYMTCNLKIINTLVLVVIEAMHILHFSISVNDKIL